MVFCTQIAAKTKILWLVTTRSNNLFKVHSHVFLTKFRHTVFVLAWFIMVCWPINRYNSTCVFHSWHMLHSQIKLRFYKVGSLAYIWELDSQQIHIPRPTVYINSTWFSIFTIPTVLCSFFTLIQQHSIPNHNRSKTDLIPTIPDNEWRQRVAFYA